MSEKERVCEKERVHDSSRARRRLRAADGRSLHLEAHQLRHGLAIVHWGHVMHLRRIMNVSSRLYSSWSVALQQLVGGCTIRSVGQGCNLQL